MHSDHEIYPMPSFARLAVTDLDASIEWYRTLGFAVVFSMPGMAHVRYRKYADVMLATDRGAADGVRGVGVSIYVTVENESIDDVANRAAEHGIEPAYGPEGTSWNTREVGFTDPDGYEIVFSEAVDTDRAFEDVMG